MAVVARYIIDTSAAARMTKPAVANTLIPLIEHGLVATTAILDAEALWSARNITEYEQLQHDRASAYEYLPTNDEHWHAALEAQRQLVAAGKTRSVGIHDLLTATLAAEHHITLIHYDADFDTAATVTNLHHQWVAPRGTID